ncbi:unnamed protein product [Penicillium nalgiovense]|nr:unnamed protein product [Penicillium nalgiovense]
MSIVESPDAINIEKEGPVPYDPPLLDEILGEGSTSRIARVAPGVIIKCPRFSWWYSKAAVDKWFVRGMRRSFEVEERLLQILGQHPRIIESGISDDPFRLLSAEASDGNLQNYIDRHHASIDISIRFEWRTQAAEAIQFIHGKDVIHSDLRPENFLFNAKTIQMENRWRKHYSGFFNPCYPPESTESTDIFSLGSIYYTIMTGHWPYRAPGPFKSLEEMETYQEHVDALFACRKYPLVDGLAAGLVVQQCWTGEYAGLRTLREDQRLFVTHFLNKLHLCSLKIITLFHHSLQGKMPAAIARVSLFDTLDFDMMSYKEDRDFRVQGNPEPYRRSQTLIYHFQDKKWWIKVTVEGVVPCFPYNTEPEKIKTSRERRKEFQAFISLINFQLLELLDDTITEMILEDVDPQSTKPLKLHREPEDTNRFSKLTRNLRLYI